MAERQKLQVYARTAGAATVKSGRALLDAVERLVHA